MMNWSLLCNCMCMHACMPACMPAHTEVTDSSDYGTSGDSDDDDEDRSALVTKRGIIIHNTR